MNALHAFQLSDGPYLSRQRRSASTRMVARLFDGCATVKSNHALLGSGQPEDVAAPPGSTDHLLSSASVYEKEFTRFDS